MEQKPEKTQIINPRTDTLTLFDRQEPVRFLYIPGKLAGTGRDAPFILSFQECFS